MNRVREWALVATLMERGALHILLVRYNNRWQVPIGTADNALCAIEEYRRNYLRFNWEWCSVWQENIAGYSCYKATTYRINRSLIRRTNAPEKVKLYSLEVALSMAPASPTREILVQLIAEKIIPRRP